MRQTTQTDWCERVIQALITIHAQMDEPLTYQELAELAAAAPYYFHRVFRAMVGETVAECIRRLRIERAAMRLRQTTVSITEIALDAGYDSLEAFSRVFRRYFWLTPSDFRLHTHVCCSLESPAGIHYQPLAGLAPYTLLTKEDKTMMTQVIELTAMRAVALRNLGSYAALPSSWRRFHQLLGQHGLYQPHARWMIAFHDAATELPDDQRRADVCMTVPAEFIKPDDVPEVQLIDIPAQLYGITIHWGDCEGIADTWSRWLQEWLPQSGYRQRPDGICLEWYQNDPSTTPNELSVTFLCTAIERV